MSNIKSSKGTGGDFWNGKFSIPGDQKFWPKWVKIAIAVLSILITVVALWGKL